MNSNNITAIKNRTHEAVDMNNDYTLPDYITDVRKLVRCNSRAILHNIYRNENMTVYEGELVYSLLIICEDDSLKNIIYSEDFSLNCSGNRTENAVCECTVESSSARLTSPRKINCRSKIVITAKTNEPADTDLKFKGDINAGHEFTLEMRKNNCDCLEISEISITGQRASRDIEIPSDKEEISNIVYCTVDISVNEQKVSEGKLFLRGESNMTLFYETVNTDYRQVCIKQPFSDILEEDHNADGYITCVDVTDIKATVRNNAFGEMRVVELDYSYNIHCHCYKCHRNELIADLYSTEYDSECKVSELSTCVLNGVFSSSLSINDTRGIKELCEDELISVVDAHASIATFNIDTTNTSTVISGDIKYDMICKLDTPENKYSHLTLLVPYRYEREGGSMADEVMKEHCETVTSCEAVIDKGRLITSCEIYFTVMTADVVKHRYISEVELKPCDLKDVSPLLIYYPKEDDTLWDVAKKYKSTCRDIKNVNSLNDDSLNDIKVLLLPKKKQKAVFNGII